MPNYCDYSMRVQGKPEAVDEFVKIMQADYEYDNDGNCNVDRHLWRVFEAYVDDSWMLKGIKTVSLSGYCAWSVHSCMCDGQFTYQSQRPNGNGTTLQAESERLQLAIEVYSSEPGCCFMEHFVFVNGEEKENECVEWQEFYTGDYDSVEEFNAEYGTNFTQEEFESDEYISVGGMDWDFNDWTPYLAK